MTSNDQPCALHWVLRRCSQFEKALPENENLRLVESIQRNTKRYIDVFSQAVDQVMPEKTKDIR